MIKRYSLDTNALLRFLLFDIPEQAQKTKRLLYDAESGTSNVYISMLVFVESVFILSKIYKLDKKLICEKLTGVLNFPFIEITERDLIKAALNTYETTSVGIVDSLLFHEAQGQHATLFTFDKALRKLERRVKE